MEVKKEQKIKTQEWLVMFDGQIKRSEKEIDAKEHHLEVNSQKDEQSLQLDFLGKQTTKSLLLILLMFEFGEWKGTLSNGRVVGFEINVDNLR